MAKPRRAIAPSVHRDGPGQHFLSSRKPWYGAGYYGICASHSPAPWTPPSAC
jgi:hypothetical protein